MLTYMGDEPHEFTKESFLNLYKIKIKYFNSIACWIVKIKSLWVEYAMNSSKSTNKAHNNKDGVPSINLKSLDN